MSGLWRESLQVYGEGPYRIMERVLTGLWRDSLQDYGGSPYITRRYICNNLNRDAVIQNTGDSRQRALPF